MALAPQSPRTSVAASLGFLSKLRSGDLGAGRFDLDQAIWTRERRDHEDRDGWRPGGCPASTMRLARRRQARRARHLDRTFH